MPKYFLFVVLVFFAQNIFAQPFVDPLNIRYTNAFHNKSKSATPFTHLYIGSDLPIKLKDNSYVVFSPFYESWNIDSSSNKKFLPVANSVALAVSAIIPFDPDQWTLTVTVIPRVNGEELMMDNSFQLGGALLANFKKNEHIKLKFGVYVNDEFFGIFVMPLAGIEWKINEKSNLFGLLPGRLTLEHRINKNFYSGVTFRAITNSYRLSNGDYLRIDDNQLSGFLDYYLTKHLVLSGEAGYGIMRRLRSGIGRNKNYLKNFNWDDGLFFKICASYRIRL
jgi:Domain of unknown function (DUF6268)